MEILKPITSKTNPDGTTTLRDFLGNTVGVINDPQVADEIVEAINGATKLYGGTL